MYRSYWTGLNQSNRVPALARAARLGSRRCHLQVAGAGGAALRGQSL